MPLYEHVFLARQDISAQQVDTLLQDFRTILAERGGSISKTEYWGLKSLAFRIKKNRKAHYTLMNIDAPHEAVAELERLLREDAVRHDGGEHLGGQVVALRTVPSTDGQRVSSKGRVDAVKALVWAVAPARRRRGPRTIVLPSS